MSPGFCPLCRKHWEDPPGDCKLDEHLDYWRVEAEALRKELRSVARALENIRTSYAAAKCPNCGREFAVVAPG